MKKNYLKPQGVCNIMVQTKINNKYELMLPDHRAARPEWVTGWETKRIEAMLETINIDDIVFDFGTEEGDVSALLAKYTGCKMVLFEPNDRVWPCIKAIWEGNNLPEPLDFYSGFLANKTQPGALTSWSDIAGDLIPDHGFKQLYENYPAVAQIKLDDYCEQTGVYPTVITMDCEGSEFEIIKGAEQVLRTKKPVIFMSIHPEFMQQHYDQWAVHLLKHLRDMGYEQELIDYDHELHVKFSPIN